MDRELLQQFVGEKKNYSITSNDLLELERKVALEEAAREAANKTSFFGKVGQFISSAKTKISSIKVPSAEPSVQPSTGIPPSQVSTRVPTAEVSTEPLEAITSNYPSSVLKQKQKIVNSAVSFTDTINQGGNLFTFLNNALKAPDFVSGFKKPEPVGEVPWRLVSTQAPTPEEAKFGTSPFIRGFVGGLPIPGASKQLDYIDWSKTSDTIAGLVGSTLGFIIPTGAITTGLKMAGLKYPTSLVPKFVSNLETKAPKLTSLLLGREGFQGLLDNAIRLIPTFIGMNQISAKLDTPAKERLQMAVSDTLSGFVFSRLGQMKMEPIRQLTVPFGVGYGMTYLQTKDPIQSLINGAIFEGLSAMGYLDYATQVRMQKEMVKMSAKELGISEEQFNTSIVPLLKDNVRPEDIKAKLQPERVKPEPIPTEQFDKVIKAYEFFSPNIEENLTFEEAKKRLTSENHATFKYISNDIDNEIGIKGKTISVIGDWSDGAENSLTTVYNKKIDWETLRYSIAKKGLVANQKSVIPFLVDETGPDTLYSVKIPEIKTMQDLRKALDDAGLQYRTITGDNQALIFDSGSNLAENINNLKQKYGEAIIKSKKGRGEFLGGDTRIEGGKRFKEVIDDYERKFLRRTQESIGIPSVGAEEAKGIKLEAKPEVVLKYPTEQIESKRKSITSAVNPDEAIKGVSDYLSEAKTVLANGVKDKLKLMNVLGHRKVPFNKTTFIYSFYGLELEEMELLKGRYVGDPETKRLMKQIEAQADIFAKNYLIDGKKMDRFELMNYLYEKARRNETVDIKYNPSEKLKEIITKFTQTNGTLDDLYSIITGKDFKKAKGIEKTNIIKEADKIVKDFDFGSVRDLRDALLDATPFKDLRAVDLAKAVLDDSIKIPEEYKMPDIERRAWYERAPEIPTSDEPKELKGRVDIMQAIVDELDLTLLRKRKGARGTYQDGTIKLKDVNVSDFFHETGEALVDRLSLDKIPKETKESIKREVSPLVSDFPKGERTLRQALSEFVREWFENPNVKESYPITTKYFEEKIESADNNLAAFLKQNREQFQDLIKAPALAAAKTAIYDSSIERQAKDTLLKYKYKPKTLKNKVMNWLESAYRQQVNVYANFNDIDAIIGEKGNSPKSLRVQSEFLNNRINGLEYFSLNEGIPDYKAYRATLGEIEGEGLFKNNVLDRSKLLANGWLRTETKIPDGLEPDFRAYQIAREYQRRFENAAKQGKEIKDYPPEFSPERCEQIISDVEKKIPNARELIEEKKKWYAGIKKFAIDAGLLTPEESRMIESNDILSHLNRLGSIFDADFQNTSWGNTLKKMAIGSQRPFIDPVISDLAELHSIVKRVKLNDIERELAMIARKHPEISQFIRVEEEKVRPIKVEPDEIVRMLKEQFDIPEEKLADYKEVIEQNKDLVSKIWRPFSQSYSNNVVRDADGKIKGVYVPFVENGKTKTLYLDKKYADALNLINNQSSASGLMNLIYGFTTIKRGLATYFSVNFLFKNPVRDGNAGYFRSDKLFIPIIDSIKGLRSYLNRDSHFWAAQLGGLHSVSLIASDISQTKMLLSEAKQRKFIDIKHPLQTMERFAELSESMTRLGVLRKYNINNPNELIKGILDASFATYDWNIRGEKTSVIQELNRISAFSKANVNVTDQTIRHIGKKAVRTLVRGLPFTMFSIAQWFAHKDDKDYENLPLFRKMFALNIKVGDKWLFIPIMDFYFGTFYGAPQYILSSIYKENPEIAKRGTIQLLNGLLPINIPEDDPNAASIIYGVVQKFIPDLIVPFVEDQTNKTFFTGQKIIPEYMKEYPAEEQYTEYTSEAAVALGKLLNISPARLDNYMRQYLVGLYDVVNAVVEPSLNAIGIKSNDLKREFELIDLPIINQFIKREYSPSSSLSVQMLTNEYYRLQGVYNALNKQKEKGGSAYLDYYREHSQDIRNYHALKGYYNAIKNLLSQYRLIEKNKDIPEEQKQTKLKSIRDEIYTISDIANDIYNTYLREKND